MTITVTQLWLDSDSQFFTANSTLIWLIWVRMSQNQVKFDSWLIETSDRGLLSVILVPAWQVGCTAEHGCTAGYLMAVLFAPDACTDVFLQGLAKIAPIWKALDLDLRCQRGTERKMPEIIVYRWRLKYQLIRNCRCFCAQHDLPTNRGSDANNLLTYVFDIPEVNTKG